jgi:membrane-associated phospholipid phosphatase
MKFLFLVLAFPFFYSSNAQINDTSLIQNTAVVTGKKALVGYNLKNESRHSVIPALIIPASLITYGFISLGNMGLKRIDKSTGFELNEDHPAFITHADNYLQYSPALAVYGLNIVGIKGKNNLRDRTMIYGLSTIISASIVTPLKKITKVQRPDGSGFNSFPSGHTTTAFAAAEFLRQEYGHVSPWYGIAGYAVATATGILRLYNNKHWVSDVVAGAGFGILSTKLAYWIYPSIKRKFFKNKPMNTLITPYYQEGGVGLALVYNM